MMDTKTMPPLQETTVGASIANDALVVSIIDSHAAKIWRKDMALLSSASFELKEEGGNTLLVLLLNDDVEDIFSFQSREDAVMALKAVTGALLGVGVSAILFDGDDDGEEDVDIAPVRSFSLLKWIFYLVLVCVSVVILLLVVSSPAVEVGEATKAKIGVPVPVDELFGP